MTTIPTIHTTDLRNVEPITFPIDCGPEGVRTFRVPRKQRADIVQLLASGMTLDADGNRVYDSATIRRSLILMLARELWDPTVRADTQTADEEPIGAWVEVDDVERFIDTLNSPRFDITTQSLGELVWNLIDEVTAHPTGAPKP